MINNLIQLLKTRRLQPAPPQWRSASGSPICPRCQAPALQPEKWAAATWAALAVSGLLLIWSGDLFFSPSAVATPSNRVFASIILVVGLSTIGAFMMLQRQRLRICQQCQLTVPAE